MTLDELGNFGDFVGGVGTGVLALVAIVTGSAFLLRERRKLALEQARQIRLERERELHGWMPGLYANFKVENVTDPVEMQQAVGELSENSATGFVLLKVTESPGGPGGNVGRAHDLRQLVDAEGHLAQQPTPGLFEALREQA